MDKTFCYCAYNSNYNEKFDHVHIDPEFSLNVDPSFESNVLFIKMSNGKDFETWLQVRISHIFLYLKSLSIIDPFMF